MMTPLALLFDARVDVGKESKWPWRLAECIMTGWRTFWGAGGTWNMV